MVLLSGQRRPLQPRAIRGPVVLVAARGRQLRHDEIMRALFGEPLDWPGPDTPRVYIRRLRRVLRETGWGIATVRGLGYALRPTPV